MDFVINYIKTQCGNWSRWHKEPRAKNDEL